MKYARMSERRSESVSSIDSQAPITTTTQPSRL